MIHSSQRPLLLNIVASRRTRTGSLLRCSNYAFKCDNYAMTVSEGEATMYMYLVGTLAQQDTAEVRYSLMYSLMSSRPVFPPRGPQLRL